MCIRDRLSVVTDVSVGSSVDELRDTALARFGAVHLVHNNAGVAVGGPLWTVSEADWTWVLGVNLWGVVHGIRAFVPVLLEQGEGHVVNTASLAGLTSPSTVSYTHLDTEIWDLPENDDPIYSGPKISADEMAEGIVAAMESDSFEHYVPDMRAIVESKTSNPDPFIEGMAAMLRSAT